MPNFFDPDNLTPTQRDRWDWAMAEYIRIRDQTFARQVAEKNLSEFDQLQLKTLMELQWDGAGDPKSALFFRLLEGRDALEAPPPTSRSYPWYEVLEQPGPFDVTIDIFSGDGLISINECAWEIADSNDAAQAITHAVAVYNASSEDERARRVMLDTIRDALRWEPRWRVFYEQWPPFDLWLGRRTGSGVRADVASGQLSEVDFSGGNLTVTEVLRKGATPDADEVAYECDGWKLQQA